jgi:hypothetical protein
MSMAWSEPHTPLHFRVPCSAPSEPQNAPSNPRPAAPSRGATCPLASVVTQVLLGAANAAILLGAAVLDADDIELTVHPPSPAYIWVRAHGRMSASACSGGYPIGRLLVPRGAAHTLRARVV